MTRGKYTPFLKSEDEKHQEVHDHNRHKHSLITDTWNMCWDLNLKKLGHPYPHGLAIFSPYGPSLCSTYCLWLFCVPAEILSADHIPVCCLLHTSSSSSQVLSGQDSDPVNLCFEISLEV